MATNAPRVSIGLAVYNGERYLRLAIESILTQTFHDFELIISDNASTDSTAAICQEYAARDARVRYHRNPINIGGIRNENQTFTMSRGEYFRLAAHDDICAPTLLERCVKVLDDHPDVVLVHSTMVYIDEEGKEFRRRVGVEGTARRPNQRFRQLSYRFYPCEATYGLIRSSVLRTTRLQQNYTASDRVLLCELALHGPFHLVSEPLFFKRFHEGNRYRNWRGRMAWGLPELVTTGKVTFPNWLQLFDYFETLRRVPLPTSERLLCRLWISKWVFQHAPGLTWDLIAGGMMAIRSKGWRARFYADRARWE